MNHRQRHEFAHASFLVLPPDTQAVVVKFGGNAKQEGMLRDGMRKAAKDYAQGMAKALGWAEPLNATVVEAALKS